MYMAISKEAESGSLKAWKFGLVGIFALSALFVDLVTASSFINFGALVAFTFVNLSVISHYFIREKQRKGINALRYLILPMIGTSFTRRCCGSYRKQEASAVVEVLVPST